MNSGDFELEIRRLHRGLDSLSYYDFLGLRPGCDYVAVRDAFYERAQLLHPDRYVHSEDQTLKDAVYAVYKRVTEAFNVLLDPQLRVSYDAARVRGATRLSDVARARRLSPEERQISNPFARIYVRAAREKLERGAIKAAWIDVQLGLTLEDAPPLRALESQIRSHPNAAEIDGGPR